MVDKSLTNYFRFYRPILRKAGSRLSNSKERELARRVQEEGDIEARNKLVQANVGFAFSVAWQYLNRGISLGELVSLANEGLIEAANRFDGKYKVRFISYAVSWIRQPILKALDELSIVHRPNNKLHQSRRVRQYEKIMAQVRGELSNPAEVQEELDLTAGIYEELQSMEWEDLSLNMPVDDDNPKGEYGDKFSYEEDALPDGVVQGKETVFLLDRFIRTLNPKEQRVIRLFFGLEFLNPEILPRNKVTLKQIGREVGITRERTRQIKVEALLKLKDKILVKQHLSFPDFV